MLSDRRAYKYKVKFYVKKVSIAIGFPCKMGVVFKKGKKKIPFTTEPMLDVKKYEARFEETIEFESIYFKSRTNGQWIKEESTITVVIMTPKKNKTAGVLKLSLTDFLNAGKQKSPAEVVKLQRCPDKKARFYFAYQLVRQKELTEEELKNELTYDPNMSVLTDTMDFSMLTSLNMSSQNPKSNLLKGSASKPSEVKPLNINILSELK